MNISTMNKPKRPVKVIQFGEGGFLRGFADWMIQKMNEQTDFNGSVAVVQPIENGLCGAVLTQLSDVEDETNGLLTYDRRIEKINAHRMADLGARLQAAMEETK